MNHFHHNRVPASIDEQTVIRMNRDTLYSFAIVDLAEGAVLTLPDSAGRYMSAMIVNNDHYVTSILHAAGAHTLDAASVGTRYALVAVRTLVDPGSPDDIAAVAALQDQIGLTAASAVPFVSPEYDTASRTRPARRCSLSPPA